MADVQHNSNSPVETGFPSASELLNVAPKSLLGGLSAFITSWFGFEHYLPKLTWVKEKMVGKNGEKIIGDTLSFINDDLKSIIRLWKSDKKTAHGETADGSRVHTLEEVVDQIEIVTKRYGLTKEADLIAQAKAELAETSEMLASKTDNMGREALRRKMGVYAQGGYTFFDFLYNATSKDDGQTTKAMQALDNNTRKIEKFVHKHDLSVIGRYRTPITALVTSAAAAAVGYGHIKQDRITRTLLHTFTSIPDNRVSHASSQETVTLQPEHSAEKTA